MFYVGLNGEKRVHLSGFFFLKKKEEKIFRHAEYESARRDLNFFMGKELELLVLWLFFI